MTKAECAKYAQDCRRAKKNGESKPERPDGIGGNSLLDVHKTLIVTQTSLNLLNEQMDSVVDFLFKLRERSPQAEAYAQTLDYIWGQMLELEIRLKKIR